MIILKTDIEIINQTLYLATSDGLLTSNYNDNLLSLPTSWMTSFDFIDISSIVESSDDIYISYDNQIVDYNNDNIFSTLNNNTEIVVSFDNAFLLAIGTESLTSFDASSIASPSVEWMVIYFTPNLAADLKAPRTVAGMSGSFRSRKISADE